jgi:hypothetical protein
VPNLRARLIRLESMLPSRVTARLQTEAERLQDIARFDAFFGAVASEHEQQVFAALFPFALGRQEAPHDGLSSWILQIVAGAALCPPRIPPKVTAVYLGDPLAQPKHECAGCRLHLPFRPGRQGGPPPVIYFKTCPACGGEVRWRYQGRYWRRGGIHGGSG